MITGQISQLATNPHISIVRPEIDRPRSPKKEKIKKKNKALREVDLVVVCTYIDLHYP